MQAIQLKNRETLLQSMRELWCGGCGYGVVVRREPPECPMCREDNWCDRPRPAYYN